MKIQTNYIIMPHHNIQNQWPKKSAGNRMTEKIPVVPPSYSLAEISDYISKNINKFESINYIYVADENKKLIGVFSIKELYKMPAESRAKDFSKKPLLISVKPTAHQEEAAYLALKHNIKAIPVVDEKGVLLGVIPNDVILSIIHHETREDILKFSGIHRSHAKFDNVMEIPFTQSIKHRIPWLFLGLLGGLIAAKIIGYFENTIEKNLILAAFIPLVVYIADATGTQLQSFAIRDFVVFKKLDAFKYLIRQFLILFVISILLGLTFMTVSLILNHNFNIALVLTTAIIIACLSSIITGIIIPFILRSFRSDPANASGPIGTIIQDILSVAIYFIIASWLL